MLAGFMGLFGILCGVLFLVAHLTSLRSFSIPYFAPVTPAFFSDWKDTIFRFPRPQLNKTIPSYFRNLFRMKK
jgi:spore germination protein KA